MSKKITQLPAAESLTGAELVEAVQGGVNVQTTTQDIANLGGGGGLDGHVIQDEGAPFTQRGIMNFVGDGVTVTDDSGGGKTVVTIPGVGDAFIETEDVTGTTYEFTEADHSKVKRFTNAAGCTATVPLGLTVGWLVNVYRADGAGTLTIASAGSLESVGTQLEEEKTMATIFVRDTNIHVAIGDFGTAGGGGTWGSITGTLSSQTDLQTALDAKQDEDATLTALAGLATGANKIPYSTGTDAFGQIDLKDEDDMASNSATAVPTQQSVKAYFDANALAYTPADELTEVAGLSLETDITAAQLLSALGIITYIPVHADVGTGITLTSHANSEQSLVNNATLQYMRLDTRLVTQMRLSVRVSTTSASANNPRLYIQYSTTGGASYTTLGAGTIASGDAISLFTGAAAVQNTNWITLPGAAQANDLVWRIAQNGGNGSASPVIGNVFIQCKY